MSSDSRHVKRANELDGEIGTGSPGVIEVRCRYSRRGLRVGLYLASRLLRSSRLRAICPLR